MESLDDIGGAANWWQRNSPPKEGICMLTVVQFGQNAGNTVRQVINHEPYTYTLWLFSVAKDAFVKPEVQERLTELKRIAKSRKESK